jgi:hypothetical protein
MEKVRVTTRQNLNELLRQKLQDQGIPAEYLNGIISLAVANLTSPSPGSFDIETEEPAPGHTADTWAWLVEAREPGNYELDLKMVLSARIPSRGQVEAHPVFLTRTVVVDAGPFYPYGDFLGRHWLEMAGSLAGLMAAWLIWLLWRTRGAAFTHH